MSASAPTRFLKTKIYCMGGFIEKIYLPGKVSITAFSAQKDRANSGTFI